MKKTLIALVLALSVLASTGIAAFAAPTTVNSGAASNTGSLIYVKKPETLYDVTTATYYTISATAKSGTKVTVYKKGDDGLYHKIYADPKTIGASGLYTVTVSLTNGTNNFLLYAEGKAILVQIVKIDITKSTQSYANPSGFGISSSGTPLA